MQELSIDSARASQRPSLAKYVRLQIDPVTGEPVLLSQEAVLTLNRSGYEILQRCDGRRTLTQLISELETQYQVNNGKLVPDVLRYVDTLNRKGLLQWI
jgi:pyrroloquinoline quinone biosynthesis protein D